MLVAVFIMQIALIVLMAIGLFLLGFILVSVLSQEKEGIVASEEAKRRMTEVDPGFETPTETMWVPPSSSKPRIIRRTEEDEAEMDKPLGDRRL